MSMLGKKVIVRTTNAGVHYGTLASLDGQQVVLNKARRIWYWEGAFTLSAIAVDGVSKRSKISVAVPEILLNEAVEVIPCQPESINSLDGIEAHHV